MATIETATQAQSSQPGLDPASPQAQPLRQRLLRKAAGLIALPDVIQADNLQRLQRLGQQRYAKLHELKEPTEDEMGIHIGDIYNAPQTTSQPAKQDAPALAPAAQPAAAPIVSAAPAALSKLARAGVLAATLGSGAAIPLGASALLDWWNKPTPIVSGPATINPGGWQLRIAPPEQGAPE